MVDLKKQSSSIIKKLFSLSLKKLPVSSLEKQSGFITKKNKPNITKKNLIIKSKIFIISSFCLYNLNIMARLFLIFMIFLVFNPGLRLMISGTFNRRHEYWR